MSEFNLSKPNRAIRVGVILCNSVTEALDIVPVDLLNGISKEFVDSMPELIPEPFQKQAMPFEFHWVAEQGSKEKRKLTSGMDITPTHSFEDCPPLDIVLVGAHNINYNLTPAEAAYVRKAYEECSAFMTVCGGILIAVQAGIVSGKTITGPRFLMDSFHKAAPDANWVVKRHVQDGKLWTSGALLNGLDMMYTFMRQTWPSSGGEPNLIDIGLSLGSGVNRDMDYKDEPLPSYMPSL